MRRALGLRRSWRQKVAPFVLLGVVTIPAIVNVGIGYVTRDQLLVDRIEIITYRDYVGVSSALLLFVALVAPDVMCPDRRQHVLPLMFARPLTGVDYVVAKVGAIATILFAFSFLPAGRAVRRQHARQRQRARLLHRPPRRPVEGAGRGRCCWPLYYAVIGVAIASLTDRRIVAGAAVIGLFLVTSISSGDHRRRLRARRRLGRRAASTCWRCRCTCATSCSSATSTRTRRSTASPTAGCSRVATYVVVLARRRRRAAAPLPLGRALMPSPTPTRRDARPTTRRSRPTRPSRSPTCRCGSGRRSRCPS